MAMHVIQVTCWILFILSYTNAGVPSIVELDDDGYTFACANETQILLPAQSLFSSISPFRLKYILSTDRVLMMPKNHVRAICTSNDRELCLQDMFFCEPKMIVHERCPGDCELPENIPRCGYILSRGCSNYTFTCRFGTQGYPGSSVEVLIHQGNTVFHKRNGNVAIIPGQGTPLTIKNRTEKHQFNNSNPTIGLRSMQSWFVIRYKFFSGSAKNIDPEIIGCEDEVEVEHESGENDRNDPSTLAPEKEENEKEDEDRPMDRNDPSTVAPEKEQSMERKNNGAIVAGSVVGALLLLSILIIAMCFFHRRHLKRRKSSLNTATQPVPEPKIPLPSDGDQDKSYYNISRDRESSNIYQEIIDIPMGNDEKGIIKPTKSLHIVENDIYSDGESLKDGEKDRNERGGKHSLHITENDLYDDGYSAQDSGSGREPEYLQLDELPPIKAADQESVTNDEGVLHEAYENTKTLNRNDSLILEENDLYSGD